MKYIRNTALYFGCLSLVSILLLEPSQAQDLPQNKYTEESQRKPVSLQEENNENQSVRVSDSSVHYNAHSSKRYRKRIFQIFKVVVAVALFICISYLGMAMYVLSFCICR